MSDEYEIDDTPVLNKGAKAVVDHFTYGPEDVEKLSETPLAWTELCEPMLKELYCLTEKRKEVTAAEKDLKKELQVFVGLERGMIQRGAFGAKVIDTSGKKKIDWKKAVAEIKAYVEAQISKEAVAEITDIVKKHTTTGEDGISITPYVVGKPPADEDDEG